VNWRGVGRKTREVKSMKKAAIVGERQAELIDAPDPKAKGNWALVKVHAAPMCAEYKAFVAGGRHEFLGHEAAGEVVEVAQPGRVKVGDRVVVQPQFGCARCRHCVAGDYIHCQDLPDFAAIHGSPEGSATMAQYLLKQDWLLSPIPDGVPYEKASLALCALGPSFGAFEAMGLGAFDTVLITGAGPVGLGGVANARFRGARVIVVESVPFRVERAKQMGAAAVIDPCSATALDDILALTDGARGVDKALDCSGAIAAERLCIDAARRKGIVAYVGESWEPVPITVSADMIRKGLTVLGSWHYNLSCYRPIMQIIRESPVIDLLISHVLPMSRIQEAFEVSASHETAKVILKPWE
jgi:threonine dehydrogenase-like Zn-dependent dehydrogenase